jgi:hypothetical protein
VALCKLNINRRFGGSCRLQLQIKKACSNRLTIFVARDISSTLKMEAARSSETSVCNQPTKRRIPEDGILRTFLTSQAHTIPAAVEPSSFTIRGLGVLTGSTQHAGHYSLPYQPRMTDECHLVHHKFHTNRPRIELKPESLSYGKALSNL